MTINKYQESVDKWILATFNEEIRNDSVERNHRFLEEALELAQANNCSKEDAIKLVEYVYNRPVGETVQEVGGVMNTLAALCNALGIDMGNAAKDELIRCWEKMEKIREKHKTKPKGSPLPGEVNSLKPYFTIYDKHEAFGV